MNKSIKAVIFDFDNTIVHMPTEIKLFHQTQGNYVGLSTAEFAKHKHLIGKDGFLKNCSFDATSFEEFCSHKGKSFLIDDLVEILRSSEPSWQAYYFNYFLEMLSTEDGSHNVYILSARAHSPEEFLSGLKILQGYLEGKHGIKIFLPQKEHLHFVGDKKHIALAKASVIESIVMKESSENTTEIEFADDDHDNVEKAQSLLEEIKYRFSHITFTVSHVLENTVKKVLIGRKK